MADKINPVVGYWGAVTSSVDFCESNYSLSPFIAEPANSLSSLIYVFHGLVGYFMVNKLRGTHFVVEIANIHFLHNQP